MHEHISTVGFIWLLVWDGCEPSQSILKNIDSKRIDSIYQNINSEIKFKTVNQKRIGDVCLGHNMIMGMYVLPISSKEYALTLTHAFRLHNEERWHKLFCLFLTEWRRILSR